MTKIEILIENAVRKVIKEEFKKILIPVIKEIKVLKESRVAPTPTVNKIKTVDKPTDINELKSIQFLKNMIESDDIESDLLTEEDNSITKISANSESDFLNRDYSKTVAYMQKRPVR